MKFAERHLVCARTDSLRLLGRQREGYEDPEYEVARLSVGEPQVLSWWLKGGAKGGGVEMRGEARDATHFRAIQQFPPP
jgi:hypothetical protein